MEGAHPDPVVVVLFWSRLTNQSLQTVRPLFMCTDEVCLHTWKWPSSVRVCMFACVRACMYAISENGF